MANAVAVRVETGWAASASKRTIFLNLFDPFALLALQFLPSRVVMGVVDDAVQIMARDGNGCSVPQGS